MSSNSKTAKFLFITFKGNTCIQDCCMWGLGFRRIPIVNELRVEDSYYFLYINRRKARKIVIFYNITKLTFISLECWIFELNKRNKWSVFGASFWVNASITTNCYYLLLKNAFDWTIKHFLTFTTGPGHTKESIFVTNSQLYTGGETPTRLFWVKVSPPEYIHVKLTTKLIILFEKTFNSVLQNLYYSILNLV